MSDKLKTHRQYLLGTLPENESREIDLQLITDDSLEEDLHFAEENLIEDFLEGNLAEEEKTLFHSNFLISKDRYNQVETIANLKRYAKGFDNGSIVDEEKYETKLNFFQRLKTVFPILTPANAIISLLVIGFLLCLVWLVYFNDSNGLSDLEREYVELNKADFNDLSKFDEASRIVLINGQTRSEKKLNELLKRKMSEKVLFNLALPNGISKNEKFKIFVLKNNEKVFTQTDIPIYQNDLGSELRFVLPSKIFQVGQYQIIVESTNTTENKTVYSFSVK